MMRTLCSLVVFLFLGSLSSMGQTVELTSLRHNMHYVKKHLLMRNDSDFTVVDINLEWPEGIDYQPMSTLRRNMAGVLGTSCTEADSIADDLLQHYGTPVTRQLPFIPDDNRFCYANYEARLLSYDPYNYVCFFVEKKVEPQKKSRVKAAHSYRYFTYDMQRQRLYQSSNLIRSSLFATGNVSYQFQDALFAPLDDDAYESLEGCSIDGIWLGKETVGFHVNSFCGEQVISYEVPISTQTAYEVLSSAGRRMLTRKPKTPQPQIVPLPVTVGQDTIYNKVETMPQFKGGPDSLNTYMTRSVIPDLVSTSGRPTVAFVVDERGKLSDFRVIDPCTPELDRYAVSLVRSMPDWTPGKQGGKPLKVRMTFPINFKK